MTPEYLKEQLDLRVDEGRIVSGGKPTYYHLRELFGQIERYVSESNKQVNTLTITGGVSNIFYLGVPSETGTYADGTWRINSQAGSYSIEQKQSGSWILIYTASSDKLFVVSGFGAGTAIVTDDYTVDDDDYNILCDTSSKSFDVTLPALTGNRHLRVSVDGSGSVTLVGTIGSDTDPEIYDGETADLVDSLTRWTV